MKTLLAPIAKTTICNVFGICLLALAGCQSPSTQEVAEMPGKIDFVTSEALQRSGLPLSTLVETDGLVFLSGNLGVKSGVGLVPGGIGPETRQTMDNIKRDLASVDLSMDRIIKCTVMLADMAEWSEFNSVYKEYFEGNYPARSAFGASALAANARVEIECIAKR